MSLSQRLQKVQQKVEMALPELEPMSLLEMEQLEINFGNTHKGKTFIHMWEMEQGWVTWFVAHYQNSTNLKHRRFLSFVTSMVERAELSGKKVAVTPSEKDLDVHTGKGYGKKSLTIKGRSKAMAAPPMVPAEVLEELNPLTNSDWFNPEEIAENESFEMVTTEPTNSAVGHLESRMLNLENALSRVIQHLEVMAAQPQTPQDQ